MERSIMQIVEKEGNGKEFDYKGYRCSFKRHPELLHLCGYIEIPKGHPLYGMNYTQIEERYNYELPTHGGLTFAGRFDDSNYLIGFDCAHSCDYAPGLGYFGGYEIYRTAEYVENTIKDIVDFIIEKEVE